MTGSCFGRMTLGFTLGPQCFLDTDLLVLLTPNAMLRPNASGLTFLWTIGFRPRNECQDRRGNLSNQGLGIFKITQ